MAGDQAGRPTCVDPGSTLEVAVLMTVRVGRAAAGDGYGAAPNALATISVDLRANVSAGAPHWG
jgi:hypothetical protein